MLPLGTTIRTFPSWGLLKRLTSSRIVLHFLPSSSSGAGPVALSAAYSDSSYCVLLPSTSSSCAYSIVEYRSAKGSSDTMDLSFVPPSTSYPTTALPHPVTPVVTARATANSAALLPRLRSILFLIYKNSPRTYHVRVRGASRRAASRLPVWQHLPCVISKGDTYQ